MQLGRFCSRTFFGAWINVKGGVSRKDVAFPVKFLAHGQRGVFPVHQLIRKVPHSQVLEMDVLNEKQFLNA